MNAAKNVILFLSIAITIARRLNEAATPLKDVSLKSNFSAEI
jgi:hypothetical protein